MSVALLDALRCNHHEYDVQFKLHIMLHGQYDYSIQTIPERLIYATHLHIFLMVINFFELQKKHIYVFQPRSATVVFRNGSLATENAAKKKFKVSVSFESSERGKGDAKLIRGI